MNRILRKVITSLLESQFNYNRAVYLVYFECDCLTIENKSKETIYRKTLILYE